jgi:hypothetical protein
VLPWESRRDRRNGRAGRQRGRGLGLGLSTLERLEGRELLAYTPLGYSLPDLTVSGYTSSSAAWGGPLTITLNIQNLGASTLPEPTALQPGAVSHADAGPTNVAVILARSPHPNSRNSFIVASIGTPAVAQNSAIQETQTITLPAQPRGFPSDGGKVYVSFRINPTGIVNESDYTDNFAKSTNPLLIEAPLPELDATALDVPPVMQPGDTIEPVIRVTNFGPASTGSQGPVTVDLVASTTRKFNTGSSILATYTVTNIPGNAQVSTGSTNFAVTNLNPQQNTVTITGTPLTLPTTPRVYFIGVVVDPKHTIKQIHQIGGVRTATNALSLSQQVGPPIKGLPPAGVIFAGGGANNLPFPYPPNVTVTTPTSPQTGVKTT